ncbi:putative lipid II flippase FtsW [Chiayiivirga flava]|uniref:Probable peptidoglycan glycosyltransferase FtsW n=1 Tax=Chiayiivirga flava TaxID=659595 RepID=A0A7W8D6F3_9GAMM|nr:putative lipid II flippase FtsW [Chiayiivirga flava]MBB5208784.1 cell division protein FtsW [Chiayiivirga flava]
MDAPVFNGLFNAERVRQAFRLGEIEGRYDRVLFGTAVALASLGLIMVASSSIAIAEGLEVGPFYFLLRHVVFLCGGVAIAFAIARLELKHVERSSQLLLLLCFLLLVAVFVPVLGVTVNGARRWINLGVSNFQTVEVVKLLLIVWLASYLVRYREQVQTRWWGIIKPLGIAGGLVVLLLAQPDFGSALLICAITGGMIWLGGVRVRNLVAPMLVAAPMMAVAAMSESYRVKRLTSFLDPWADPFNDGFQLTQALIAIGRGEWLGVGLGGSVQKLFYLPEAHTDFIFAVIAEELGFAGILLVIGLFALLVGRACWLGLRAVELGRHFAGYCAFGVALWIGLQALVSIGVNLGVLPTKGLTLPLISSGGSSVLMTCAAIGLLLRVSFEIDRTERQVARLRHGVNAATLDADELDPAPPVPNFAGMPTPVMGPVRGRVEPTLGAMR